MKQYTLTVVEHYYDGGIRTYIKKYPFRFMRTIYIWWLNFYQDNFLDESPSIKYISTEIN